MSASTSRSRGVSSRAGLPLAASEELADHLRVDRGAALPDSPHGIQEVVDLEHTVLEQVAEALRPLADERERVRRLHDLREEQYADLGCSARISSARRARPRRSASGACGRRRQRRPA